MRKGSEKCMFIVKGFFFFMSAFSRTCWREVLNYAARSNPFGRAIA